MRSIIVLSLIVLSGCATSTHITKLKSVNCDSKPAEVEIFMRDEKPSKPYEKLALISADNKNNGNIDESEIIETVRKEASGMCADAIMVQEISDMPLFLKRVTTVRAVAIKYN